MLSPHFDKWVSSVLADYTEKVRSGKDTAGIERILAQIGLTEEDIRNEYIKSTIRQDNLEKGVEIDRQYICEKEC